MSILRSLNSVDIQKYYIPDRETSYLECRLVLDYEDRMLKVEILSGIDINTFFLYKDDICSLIFIDDPYFGEVDIINWAIFHGICPNQKFKAWLKTDFALQCDFEITSKEYLPEEHHAEEWIRCFEELNETYINTVDGFQLDLIDLEDLEQENEI